MTMSTTHRPDAPLSALVDIIKFAVAESVRSAGGNQLDIDRVAVAAAYAAWCWGSASAFETVPQVCHQT
ncbi:putative uncharacterized protein [Mycolicibacterium canariasense]|nr:putative uncharacterized protein [Mycolicibacterium canariasense]